MKKILIVVDMQNDFITGPLGTKEAQSIVDEAVKIIENFDGDIFATYDTHFEDYPDTLEGINLPVVHCVKDTRGWEIDERIFDALNKKGFESVEKVTFGSVDLPEIISERYDTSDIEIEMLGLCTDICVVSNALILKANFPEVKITLWQNACAGVTPESHNGAITTMKMCQINVK